MSTDTHLEADFMLMSATMFRAESRTVLRSERRSTKLCMRVNNRLLGWKVSKHSSEGQCQAGGHLTGISGAVSSSEAVSESTTSSSVRTSSRSSA